MGNFLRLGDPSLTWAAATNQQFKCFLMRVRLGRRCRFINSGTTTSSGRLTAPCPGSRRVLEVLERCYKLLEITRISVQLHIRFTHQSLSDSGLLTFTGRPLIDSYIISVGRCNTLSYLPQRVPRHQTKEYIYMSVCLSSDNQ